MPISRFESEMLVSNRLSWRPSTEESNDGLFGTFVRFAEDCTHSSDSMPSSPLSKRHSSVEHLENLRN